MGFGSAGSPLSAAAVVPDRRDRRRDRPRRSSPPRKEKVLKWDSAGEVRYHYDQAGRVIAESRPDGSKIREYVCLGNTLILVDGCVTTDLQSACGARNWLHADTLGSVVARTDASGAVAARSEHHAWGEQSFLQGAGGGVGSMRIALTDELKASAGRPLSDYCSLVELRIYLAEEDDGYRGPAVELILAAGDAAPTALSLRAFGVREFHCGFAGRPVQVMGFDVESLRGRQMEGINWRVFDYEDDRIGFLCRELEVVSVGPLPAR